MNSKFISRIKINSSSIRYTFCHDFLNFAESSQLDDPETLMHATAERE